MARIYLGNVKGPKGDTGATGATGPQGEAATIEVGSVSTTAYGNAAQVTNVGSPSAAKFNFVIPQGKPGEKTTKMGELTLDTITTSVEEFPSPSVGDTGATAFGKIVKWFADGLAALTSKLDANKVVDSQVVTEDGYALSAKQANPNISGSLAAQISTLNDSLTHYNRTGDMTMEVSQYSARYLAVFQRIVIFEIVLPSFTAGILKIAVLPTTVRPTMQVSLSVSTELSADRAGHQEAFVNTAGEVYAHRERNCTGKISISGCWYLP